MDVMHHVWVGEGEGLVGPGRGFDERNARGWGALVWHGEGGMKLLIGCTC